MGAKTWRQMNFSLRKWICCARTTKYYSNRITIFLLSRVRPKQNILNTMYASVVLCDLLFVLFMLYFCCCFMVSIVNVWYFKRMSFFRVVFVVWLVCDSFSTLLLLLLIMSIACFSRAYFISLSLTLGLCARKFNDMSRTVYFDFHSEDHTPLAPRFTDCT